jgi:hypothetical protein
LKNPKQFWRLFKETPEYPETPAKKGPTLPTAVKQAASTPASLPNVTPPAALTPASDLPSLEKIEQVMF